METPNCLAGTRKTSPTRLCQFSAGERLLPGTNGATKDYLPCIPDMPDMPFWPSMPDIPDMPF